MVAASTAGEVLDIVREESPMVPSLDKSIDGRGRVPAHVDEVDPCLGKEALEEGKPIRHHRGFQQQGLPYRHLRCQSPSGKRDDEGGLLDEHRGIRGAGWRLSRAAQHVRCPVVVSRIDPVGGGEPVAYCPEERLCFP